MVVQVFELFLICRLIEDRYGRRKASSTKNCENRRELEKVETDATLMDKNPDK